MNKTDFKNIEKDFCALFNIPQKESTVLDRYEVNTVNGLYKVWFDTDGAYAIFGQFQDVKNITTKPMLKDINPYSGKMNFHGNNDINNFLDTLSTLKA